jgi:hypothetical protein
MPTQGLMSIRHDFWGSHLNTLSFGHVESRTGVTFGIDGRQDLPGLVYNRLA